MQTEVVKFVVRETGFKPDTEIEFSENLGEVANRNGTDSPDEDHIRTKYSDVVFVDVEETYDQEELMARMRSIQLNYPLIEDKSLGLAAYSLYTPMKCRLTLRFRARSKAVLKTWARQLAMREKLQPLSFNMNINYNYAIPLNLANFIKHIHALRENQGGYGDTLEDYVDAISVSPTVKRSNRSGGYVLTTIEEEQQGIEGHFVSEGIYNEPELDEGIHQITATFEFDYEAIAGIIVDFPFIVHNQFIDIEYINNWIKFRQPDLEPDKELSCRVVSKIPEGAPKKHHLDDGIPRLIEFDGWFPKGVYGNTKTLLLSPIQVNPADPFAVTDLNAIGHDLIPEPISRYIQKYPESVKTYLKGPYLIEVFGLDPEQYRYSFNIVNGSEIRTTLPMEIRGRYYLRISAIDDHSRIRNQVIRDFLMDVQDTKDALWALVPAIMSTQKYLEGALHSPDGRSVTVRSYNDVIRLIKTTNKTFKNLPPRNWNTVMTANIIAKRD